MYASFCKMNEFMKQETFLINREKKISLYLEQCLDSLKDNMQLISNIHKTDLQGYVVAI